MRHTPTARRARLDRPSAMALVVVLAAAILSAFLPTATAQAAELPANLKDGGMIISDAEFFDEQSMTVAQVQAFLEKRVPTCRATTGPDCLRNFTGSIEAKSADSYCGAIKAYKNVSAATIIVAVSRACGINPKVVLVMLQKEQGLVTATRPSDWSYRAAMGMNCPDTAPCDAASAGFVNQVYLGVRQQQVYAKNPTRYNYRAGQVNTIQWHPDATCGTSKVYIENQATANLYIYTPYRPNVAALAAGYAEGDACSTYGNRNFYNYYVQWFEPDASENTSGAPAKVAACTVPASADVVSRKATYAVKTSSATVRTAPTLVCGETSSLSKGAKVAVTGIYGAWARATVSGKTRWVLTSSLDIPDPSCVVPPASQITAASGTVTVRSDSLNARKAPTTACSSGRITLDRDDKPTRTGIYGAWWRITHGGETYWIHSDYATVSGGTASCTTAPSSTAANGTYRVASARAYGRTGPSSLCTAGAKTLTAGTVLVASAASTDGMWLRVTDGATTMWVAKASLAPAAADAACVQPTAVTAISGAYRVTSSRAYGRAAPTSLCSVGAKVFTTGDTLSVTAKTNDGTWLRVKDGSATRWVAAASMAPVPDACAQPGSVADLSGTFRVSSTRAYARTAPSSECSTGVKTLSRGATVAATAQTTDGVWVRITDGAATRWVARASLTAVPTDVCAAPSKTTSVSKTYQVTSARAYGRTGPSGECSTGVKTLSRGTVLVASAATSDGAWLRVNDGVAARWVAAASVRAVASGSACAQPTSVKNLDKTYRVTSARAYGRLAPSASCGAAVKTLTKGTALTATAVTGDGRWLRVTSASGSMWVAAASVD
ncbi:SH3 domain-containing protein [Microbacterium dauci]|uniref:SH3 domain-containing protein n=1 Tax=Microbacterium dauci TaxID=3048008 RepID=A0ABT6Z9T7_9MICO|nr:SH3 domain-containing protein [Microbacterium sp. LX3-4]MDJ1112930.1 SH3 domain-containing protein [Microbacterium sp. LX3-4]